MFIRHAQLMSQARKTRCPARDVEMVFIDRGWINGTLVCKIIGHPLKLFDAPGVELGIGRLHGR
jgi:hypothetical protein